MLNVMLVSRAPLQHDIGYVLDLAVLCTKMALCGEEHLTEFRIRPVYPNNIFSLSQMLFLSNFKVAGQRADYAYMSWAVQIFG